MKPLPVESDLEVRQKAKASLATADLETPEPPAEEAMKRIASALMPMPEEPAGISPEEETPQPGEEGTRKKRPAP